MIKYNLKGDIMNENEKITLGAWVARSTYRMKVLNVLKKHKAVPTSIARESGIKKYHISNVLKPLKEKELIKCLNEDETKGRVYMITDIGEEVLETAKEFVI